MCERESGAQISEAGGQVVQDLPCRATWFVLVLPYVKWKALKHFKQESDMI